MPKKILIVDDEEDIRSTVKTILNKQGYEVLTANDADEGLEQYKKNKPDLVLLDIMMPGTPVKEIIPKMPDSKIAFLSIIKTSTSEKEDLLKGENVVGFISKPFDIDHLIKQVKKLIG